MALPLCCAATLLVCRRHAQRAHDARERGEPLAWSWDVGGALASLTLVTLTLAVALALLRGQDRALRPPWCPTSLWSAGWAVLAVWPVTAITTLLTPPVPAAAPPPLWQAVPDALGAGWTQIAPLALTLLLTRGLRTALGLPWTGDVLAAETALAVAVHLLATGQDPTTGALPVVVPIALTVLGWWRWTSLTGLVLGHLGACVLQTLLHQLTPLGTTGSLW
ncbi:MULTISPECIES: hypothetical protein [Actinosynnema]|uniref:hypothetical protein n=1 Tax=Actinosynnema TaxID=40566 RepID=UPI0020A305B9|nr:hypothetical protein [Actinosynnema pretiosum]MCP2097421.1 hypothetical protein [Actinosynnema pretiosum]